MTMTMMMMQTAKGISWMIANQEKSGKGREIKSFKGRVGEEEEGNSVVIASVW